jgi:hypothetical protein
MCRLSAAARHRAPALRLHGTGRDAPHPSPISRILRATLPTAWRRALIRGDGGTTVAAALSARRLRTRPRFSKHVERTQSDVHGDPWEPPLCCKSDRSPVTIAAPVAPGWHDRLTSHGSLGCRASGDEVAGA